MPLTMIGIGLHDEKDISIRGFEAVKDADFVYLDYYTSLLSCPVKALEEFYGKAVILADRTMVEQHAEETILSQARTKNVAFLVVGDALSATTHIDLLQRCTQQGIPLNVIPNASILTAVGITGLQIYKFGKTTSIPFQSKDLPIDTPLQILAQNHQNGAHTLFLLDLDPSTQRFMSIKEGIEALLESARRTNTTLFSPQTLCIGCARIGSPHEVIKFGTAQELEREAFGPGPYCLIIPGKLHFIEEEMLKRFQIKNN